MTGLGRPPLVRVDDPVQLPVPALGFPVHRRRPSGQGPPAPRLFGRAAWIWSGVVAASVLSLLLGSAGLLGPVERLDRMVSGVLARPGTSWADVVEVVPGREYLLVTELIPDAAELLDAEVDDRVIDDALRQVRRMWDAGVAHRDVKPSNLLVGQGCTYLIDLAFGVTPETITAIVAFAAWGLALPGSFVYVWLSPSLLSITVATVTALGAFLLAVVLAPRLRRNEDTAEQHGELPRTTRRPETAGGQHDHRAAEWAGWAAEDVQRRDRPSS